jgi:ABC-2 type transport system permease protein
VLLSARARTLQDAMQLGGVLILPLLALAVAQATGLLALGPATVAASGVALWLVAALLLRAGTRSLQRDRLVTAL